MIKFIKFRQKISPLFFLFLFFFWQPNILLGSLLQREVSLTGKTMGTYYSIKIMCTGNINPTSIKQEIDVRLEMVNKSMSCYLPNSEISRFNRTLAGQSFKISNDFYRVMLQSQRLFHLTNGAWDGTIKPFVDIWGFGTKKDTRKIPDKKEISMLLGQTGFDKIIIGKNTLQKKISSVTLDLASIAKGYGVDAIGEILKNSGFKNFIVDIGGEVTASGEKHPGHPWVIGISKPDNTFSFEKMYKKIKLKNKAIATSGDYRNFFKAKGRIFSHIINPATGYPINNGVVSASVIADNCTSADGLATALMVMGHEKGLKLVNSLKHTECLIIVKEKDGTLTNFESNGFP